jgi:hypothetical protein
MDEQRLQTLLNVGSIVLLCVLAASFIAVLRAAFGA